MNCYMGVLVQAISSGYADTVKEIAIPILCFAICVCTGGNTVNMNDVCRDGQGAGVMVLRLPLWREG